MEGRSQHRLDEAVAHLNASLGAIEEAISGKDTASPIGQSFGETVERAIDRSLNDSNARMESRVRSDLADLERRVLSRIPAPPAATVEASGPNDGKQQLHPRQVEGQQSEPAPPLKLQPNRAPTRPKQRADSKVDPHIEAGATPAARPASAPQPPPTEASGPVDKSTASVVVPDVVVTKAAVAQSNSVQANGGPAA